MIKILVLSALFAAGVYGVTEVTPDELPGARGIARADCAEFIETFVESRGDAEAVVTEKDGYRFNYCARMVAR